MNEYKDPVCGMQMEPEDAASETNYEGKSFYFCTEDCRNKFDADPERYAKETASSGMRGGSTSR